VPPARRVPRREGRPCHFVRARNPPVLLRCWPCRLSGTRGSAPHATPDTGERVLGSPRCRARLVSPLSLGLPVREGNSPRYRNTPFRQPAQLLSCATKA
jgi:hypothetical protein